MSLEKQKIHVVVCKTLLKMDIKIGDDICVKDYARLIQESVANRDKFATTVIVF